MNTIHSSTTQVRRMRTPAIPFITVLFSTLLHAQISFQPTGVGGGGALYNPSFSPSGSSVFLACDMSAYYRSSNLGASWDIVDFRQLQSAGRGKVAHTNNPSILYAIDCTNDLATPSKSMDGGATWSHLSADPTGDDAWYIFADPANANNLIVGSYSTLFLSTNGGVSFAQKFNSNVNGAGCHIAGVFFDGNMMYIGTNAGLVVSTDGGANFNVSSASGIPANQQIVSFAGARQNNATRLYCIAANSVYAGIQGFDFAEYRGIYTLDYGAGSWTLKTNGIASTHYPFFLAMAQNNIDICYVAGGSDASEPIVYRTTNGGASWQNSFITANNQNIVTGWSGKGGDRDWSYGELALGFAVAPLDANKAAFTDLGFVHLTSDGGATWYQGYVHPGDQNPMNAPTPKGKSYRPNGLFNTSSWNLCWFDSLTIWACYTDVRGARSTDGGATWSFNYSGQVLNTTYRAVKHPVSGIGYVATSSIHDLYESTYLTDAKIDNGAGYVLFTTDKGATWQMMHDFGHPVIWVALDPNNANRMYASVIHSSQGGIFVSNNINAGAASTWTRLANPPRTEGHPFNILVLNDGTLVCTYSGRRPGTSGAFTASSGVFVSTNGGTSWIDRSDPGMYYWTKDIYIDPSDPSQNRWYTGVWSGWGGAPNGLGGLYRTTDRGVSWTRIFNSDRVTSCAISPNVGTPMDPRPMYVTTETEGLWWWNMWSNPAFYQVSSFHFRHPERMFYNPYNTHQLYITTFGHAIHVGYEYWPVELALFRAEAVTGGVRVFWETASETNNYGFEIERQKTENGKQNTGMAEPDDWERIGFVEGKGTTMERQSYSYLDAEAPASGTVYYRLKQIDLDGTFTYSPVAEVVRGAPDGITPAQNYPNPFSDRTTIQLRMTNDELRMDRQAGIFLKVYDLFGREVLDLSNRIPGDGKIILDGTSLPLAGVYFIRFSSSRGVSAAKIIKVR